METTDLFAPQEAVSIPVCPEGALARLARQPHRIILGVDPGASGALAFFRPDRPADIEVYDAPVADRQIDAAELARIIRASGATEAIVERVSAMPKQGVASTFKFGMAYGAVLAAVGVLGLPLRQETPGRWKKHFRLSADKEAARGLAIRTWPGSRDFSRKKDHGRAEAALLVREDGRWRLEKPDDMPPGRGPCPRRISDTTAQEAIRRGARVRRDVDLFGAVPAADLARVA